MDGPKLLARFLRISKMTQAQFGRLAGVPHSSISFFLSGRRRPGIGTASAIEIASKGAVPVEAWARPLKGSIAA